jgi:tetratricopeptide (TPR) repeat protein
VIWFIFKIFSVDPKVKEIPRNKIIPVIILVIAILIPYSVRTISRNKHWKNYLTLYERDIRYLDKSVKANVLYASALTVDLSGRFDAEGIQKDTTLIKKHYKRALELWPANYEVLNNLGSFYAYTLERYDSAIICFEQAVRYNPKTAEPYLNLAQTLRKVKLYDKAIENFRKYIEIKPESTYALTEMGNCYFEMGDLRNAVKTNEEFMRLMPASDLPYINIGNFYLQSSDTLTAIYYWEQAVEKVPQVKLCMNLSNFYRNKGDMNKARHYYELSLTAEKRK